MEEGTAELWGQQLLRCGGCIQVKHEPGLRDFDSRAECTERGTDWVYLLEISRLKGRPFTCFKAAWSNQNAFFFPLKLSWCINTEEFLLSRYSDRQYFESKDNLLHDRCRLSGRLLESFWDLQEHSFTLSGVAQPMARGEWLTRWPWRALTGPSSSKWNFPS